MRRSKSFTTRTANAGSPAMAIPRAALAVAGIAGLAYLLTSRADAVTVYPDGSAAIPLDAGDALNMPPGDDWAPGDDYSTSEPVMTPEADPVASFLYMLRSCEHN